MDTASRPACCECRTRHLKCGGQQPSCERCLEYGIDCKYVPSRRGQGPRKRRAKSRISGPLHDQAGPTSAHQSTLTAGEVNNGTTSSADSIDERSRPFQLNDAQSSRLTSLYYTYFHAAHPILPPSASDLQGEPYFLRLMVCFIGNHYETPAQQSRELHSATSAAMSTPDETSVARVQALVLYAIILHSQFLVTHSQECLVRAYNLAIALRLDRSTYELDDPSLETPSRESTRRTWWQLYIVDTYFAALHRRPSSVQACSSSSPFLPGGDRAYGRSDSDQSLRSIMDFESRMFAPEPMVFSAYSHLISSARVLGDVGRASLDTAGSSHNIDASEHAISAWEYGFSTDEAAGRLSNYSQTDDQLLVQGKVLIQCASLLLHFPRSDLPMNVPNMSELACARDLTRLTAISNRHANRALHASKEMTDLVPLPAELNFCSPLFICGIILATMVQLAAASSGRMTREFSTIQNYRDRITLLMGALSQMGTRWAVAQRASQALKPIANAIFAPATAPETLENSSVHDSGIDIADFPDDLSWFDLLSPQALSEVFAHAGTDMHDLGLTSPLPTFDLFAAAG